MSEAWTLALETLFAPGRAAERLRGPGAGFAAALRVYLTYLLTAVAFYTFKPSDFPAAAQGIGGWPALPPAAAATPLFWAKVMAWNPVLLLIWIAFLAGYCRFLKSFPFPLAAQLLGVTLYSLLPLAPILLYTSGRLERPAFLLLWAVIAIPLLYGIRGYGASRCKTLASTLMALNAVSLALFPPFCAAVILRSETAYGILEILSLFGSLILGSLLLSRVEGLSTPRAFAALFLSILSQMWLVVSMYLAGLLPKDILKAMMAV